MKYLKRLISIILSAMFVTAHINTSADDIFPKHEPYGEAVGAMKGRVVWAHEKDAVDWDGNGYWWETDNFDEAVIQSMVNSSIAKLGGETTAADGWNASVENYLHEAGLIASSPSGTVYTDSFGKTVTNLGVHEHWNNPTDKQYSRNLGKNEGIELVMADSKEYQPELIFENGKMIVNNAVENGALITAFYKDGILTGAKISEKGKTEFDIKSEMADNLSDATDLKAFFWDMKKITPLCNAVPLQLITATPTESPAPSPLPTPASKRVLTVYFSFTDNTKNLAEKIQSVTESDIYEIIPQEPYTDEILNYYGDNRAYREQNDANARPAISGSIENLDNYDIIMLGYPIWYGFAPRVVYTFLESYNFSDKTIMPFCTSGSTGIAGSLSDIRKLCPKSTVTEGFRGTASTTDTQIQNWFDSNID